MPRNGRHGPCRPLGTNARSGDLRRAVLWSGHSRVFDSIASTPSVPVFGAAIGVCCGFVTSVRCD
jgi:hypothetical protein